MIQACEGYRQHFKLGACVKEILAQRHVALHNYFGALCALYIFIRVTIRIDNNLVSCGL